MYVIVHSFFYSKNIKTKIVRILLLCLLILIFGTIFYGSFIESNRITVKNININTGKTTEHENIKIAFLTDLHVGPYKQTAFVKNIIEKTLAEKPDFIFLGGDYIMGKEIWSAYLRPLETLKNFQGKVFAVTGNHEFNNSYYHSDYKDKTSTIRKMFAEYGIKILDNDSVLLDKNGSQFYLSGIKDLWTEQADLTATLAKIENTTIPKILLSHNPDIILQNESNEFDFIISGHTHGGQIRLPFLGSVPPIPDELGRAFDKGLFQLKNGQLYISQGLGESGPRSRLFCPPELTVINLDL